MIKNYKKFYEIDRYNIDQSLQQIITFFDLIKTFTNKCHGHIKYLVYLVNNLIDSEDFLELVDSTLHHQGILKFGKNQYYNSILEENMHNGNLNGQTTVMETPNPEINNIYSQILEENKKMNDKVNDE